ncbi:MAG TPA: FG-GAP-like repeat-containing protein [Planctomycetota bacterium]|nr:FG-GAP-like repeat-containing protein [Planctomycetota bacterium]
MSPQFVDFDADGRLDIVAGIFDGSPHLVRGSAAGWQPPEQILDRDGARIVFNQFWNFDTKKWDSTHRCDGPGQTGEGHLTSAIAMDWDGDGDLDLLLGDHSSGRVYRRTNEGTPQQPAFSTRNEPVLAAGKPIDVPGTVATLRLVDWNGDGLLDLAAGSMGDAYSNGEGGGVYVYLNTGTKQAPVFAAPITLVERSRKGGTEPLRPDSGLYMDFGDHDGDGDLDLVVGGYSHWTPKPIELTAAQTQRVAALRAELAVAEKGSAAIMEAIDDATKGLAEAAADKKREELSAARLDELVAFGKKRQALQNELDPLVPGPKRASFVWLYENLGSAAKPAAVR